MNTGSAGPVLRIERPQWLEALLARSDVSRRGTESAGGDEAENAGRHARAGVPGDRRAAPSRESDARDRRCLRLAVELSSVSVDHGGGPFGAIITDPNGRVVGAGANLVMIGGSSILHAEMLAILDAQSTLGRHVLPGGHALFTSCEPCAMCLGAVLWSGLRRVVWSASREDAIAVGFDEGPVFAASHDYLRERGIALEAGPLRADAREILERYAADGGPIYNAPPPERAT